MKRITIWEKCIFIMVVAYTSTNPHQAIVFAEEDPTVHLKIIQCRAELALSNKNYSEAARLAGSIIDEAFDGPINWCRGNLLHHSFEF